MSLIPVANSDFFLFPLLTTCQVFHLSHFITKLKMYHLSLFIITQDAIDTLDPSSMQDACHIQYELF